MRVCVCLGKSLREIPSKNVAYTVTNWDDVSEPPNSTQEDVDRAYSRKAAEVHEDTLGPQDPFVALMEAHDRQMTVARELLH